ncbi:unnamed protein product [Rhizophagus irregularis]|uniref:Uncharacterized protein n=1 Tax=Rhizophagus irregularis TaxID=588596 RepID=A0A915YNV0_9GLOM|nr:unnamed protein product [Rhizophagus irregularis]
MIMFYSIVLIALVLPQAHPAPPSAGGEKKIVIVGPGAGPWSVGSQLVATWWSTGFDSDQDSTTPIFSADVLSTLNNGSIPIPIDDKYIPGTNYVTEIGLNIVTIYGTYTSLRHIYQLRQHIPITAHIPVTAHLPVPICRVLNLKSDPTIKGIGPVFTVTEGGDGPAAPELGLLGTPANNPPPPDKPPTATPAPPPGKLGICTQI